MTLTFPSIFSISSSDTSRIEELKYPAILSHDLACFSFLFRREPDKGSLLEEYRLIIDCTPILHHFYVLLLKVSHYKRVPTNVPCVIYILFSLQSLIALSP